MPDQRQGKGTIHGITHGAEALDGRGVERRCHHLHVLAGALGVEGGVVVPAAGSEQQAQHGCQEEGTGGGVPDHGHLHLEMWPVVGGLDGASAPHQYRNLLCYNDLIIAATSRTRRRHPHVGQRQCQ